MKEWRYQVYKYNLGSPDEVGYGIHEVWNIGPKGDVPTDEPEMVVAESIEELRKILQQMLTDIDKYGVLNWEDQNEN